MNRNRFVADAKAEVDAKAEAQANAEAETKAEAEAYRDFNMTKNA